MKTPSCHPERAHAGKGLCSSCYHRQNYKSKRQYYDDKAREWRYNNKERMRYLSKARDRQSPEKYLYKTAKSRAKKHNHEFNIELKDILIPFVCPVLGIPLVPFSGKFAHNSPSIDRIDNTKGYVKGNVIIVSFRANSLKKDATLNELVKLAYFYSNLKEGN